MFSFNLDPYIRYWCVYLFACKQNEAKRYVQATGRDVTQRKDAKESFITILVGEFTQFVSFFGGYYMYNVCILMCIYIYIRSVNQTWQWKIHRLIDDVIFSYLTTHSGYVHLSCLITG